MKIFKVAIEYDQTVKRTIKETVAANNEAEAYQKALEQTEARSAENNRLLSNEGGPPKVSNIKSGTFMKYRKISLSHVQIETLKKLSVGHKLRDAYGNGTYWELIDSRGTIRRI